MQGKVGFWLYCSTPRTQNLKPQSTFARNLLPLQQQQGQLTAPPTNHLPHSWFHYCCSCSHLAPIRGKTQEQKLRPLTTSEPGRLSAIAVSVHPLSHIQSQNELRDPQNRHGDHSRCRQHDVPGQFGGTAQLMHSSEEAQTGLRIARVSVSSFVVAESKLPNCAQRGTGPKSSLRPLHVTSQARLEAWPNLCTAQRRPRLLYALQEYLPLRL